MSRQAAALLTKREWTDQTAELFLNVACHEFCIPPVLITLMPAQRPRTQRNDFSFLCDPEWSNRRKWMELHSWINSRRRRKIYYQDRERGELLLDARELWEQFYRGELLLDDLNLAARYSRWLDEARGAQPYIDRARSIGL